MRWCLLVLHRGEDGDVGTFCDAERVAGYHDVGGEGAAGPLPVLLTCLVVSVEYVNDMLENIYLLTINAVAQYCDYKLSWG